MLFMKRASIRKEPELYSKSGSELVKEHSKSLKDFKDKGFKDNLKERLKSSLEIGEAEL